MLDLSPEKLAMLLAVGLVVLGPNKLPGAARALAHGLARARKMASALTDPVATTLTEPVRARLTEPLRTDLVDPFKASWAAPRQAIDDAVAALRTTIAEHPVADPGAHQRPPVILPFTET